MNIRTAPLLALILIGLGVPVLAADRCNVPQADWRPVGELTADLTAKGWKISNVKTEDGCYEVYGHDDKGQRVEVFFDPATFEAVGSDE